MGTPFPGYQINKNCFAGFEAILQFMCRCHLFGNRLSAHYAGPPWPNGHSINVTDCREGRRIVVMDWLRAS